MTKPPQTLEDIAVGEVFDFYDIDVELAALHTVYFQMHLQQMKH